MLMLPKLLLNPLLTLMRCVSCGSWLVFSPARICRGDTRVLVGVDSLRKDSRSDSESELESGSESDNDSFSVELPSYKLP